MATPIEARSTSASLRSGSTRPIRALSQVTSFCLRVSCTQSRGRWRFSPIPGDCVLIMRPCYRPFVTTVESLGRKPVFVDMIQGKDAYEIDFDGMDHAAAQCRAFILCNPHNPTGRVFTHGELESLAALCERHQLIVISDEIHSDFVYGDSKFSSIATASQYVRDHGVFLRGSYQGVQSGGNQDFRRSHFQPRHESTFRWPGKDGWHQ